MMLLVASVLASLLGGAHIALKYSAGAEGIARFALIGLALGLFVLVFGAYATALKHLDIGRLYPIYTGLSVALVYMAGVMLFKEPLTARSLAGCLLVVVGIYLLGGRHGPAG